ncbi:hypothetical protein [Nocardia ninae]|nr:hypothetical protein [Nocardia ninae]
MIRRMSGRWPTTTGTAQDTDGHGNTVPIAVAPHRLPVLGHLVPLLCDPVGFMASLPAHGDLVSIGLGRVTAVVVCDLELIRQMLRKDRIFDKAGHNSTAGES